MAEIPTMSLKVANWNPVTFTPTTYTPQTSDPTLLSRSLQLQEAREKESRQNMDIIDSALNATRAQLDVSEHNWLDEKANSIRSKIDEQIALGNYQSAIRLAQTSARDVKRDTDLQNKITVNNLRLQEKQRVNSMNIDPITKRRWDAINPYKYEGTADWKPEWTPVNDISISDIWNEAVAKSPIRSKSTSNQVTNNSYNFTNNKGEIISSPTEETETTDGGKTTQIKQGIIGSYSSIGTTRGNSSSYQEKTEADIINMFYDLLKDSNKSAALKQNYDNMQWLYKNAQEILNNPNATESERQQAITDMQTAKESLTDKDGFLYSGGNNKGYEDWLDAQVKQYAKDSAYRHTSTSTTKADSIGYNESAFNTISGINNQNAVNNLSAPGTATVQGPSVVTTGGYQFGTYNAVYMVPYFVTPTNANPNNSNN